MDEQEQRRLPRRIAGWNVSYRLERRPGRGWHGCRMLDFSASGAALEIYDATADELRSEHLVVDLELGLRAGSGAQVRARVRNISPGPYGGVRVGLEFADRVPKELAMLLESEGEGEWERTRAIEPV